METNVEQHHWNPFEYFSFRLCFRNSRSRKQHEMRERIKNGKFYSRYRKTRDNKWIYLAITAYLFHCLYLFWINNDKRKITFTWKTFFLFRSHARRLKMITFLMWTCGETFLTGISFRDTLTVINWIFVKTYKKKRFGKMSYRHHHSLRYWLMEVKNIRRGFEFGGFFFGDFSKLNFD